MHLFIAVALATAPIAVPAETQRLADLSVLVGSCERHVPPQTRAVVDELVRSAEPAKRHAIEQWREEGRRMAREQPIYTRDVCERLLGAHGLRW